MSVVVWDTKWIASSPLVLGLFIDLRDLDYGFGWGSWLYLGFVMGFLIIGVLFLDGKNG